jgi:hypothetical protein
VPLSPTWEWEEKLGAEARKYVGGRGLETMLKL